ncbi:MAG: DUF202 domain-containing protein [Lentisphaerae bacterium]|nr:DUF202 domain-containing protein [Lentisphaerota bacterium]
MPPYSYEKFKAAELILRDELALSRTELANERTLLAYLRTALMLLVSGVTFLHFMERGYLLMIGMACIPLGLGIGLYGYIHFRSMRRLIATARREQ